MFRKQSIWVALQNTKDMENLPFLDHFPTWAFHICFAMRMIYVLSNIYIYIHLYRAWMKTYHLYFFSVIDNMVMDYGYTSSILITNIPNIRSPSAVRHNRISPSLAAWPRWFQGYGRSFVPDSTTSGIATPVGGPAGGWGVHGYWKWPIEIVEFPIDSADFP